MLDYEIFVYYSVELFMKEAKTEKCVAAGCHNGCSLDSRQLRQYGSRQKQNLNDSPHTNLEVWLIYMTPGSILLWRLKPLSKQIAKEVHKICQLTPADNLMTLTLELTCGPSPPPPVLALCMTVLFTPGLLS